MRPLLVGAIPPLPTMPQQDLNKTVVTYEYISPVPSIAHYFPLN